jgi:hypothetical protein
MTLEHFIVSYPSRERDELTGVSSGGSGLDLGASPGDSGLDFFAGGPEYFKIIPLTWQDNEFIPVLMAKPAEVGNSREESHRKWRPPVPVERR